LCRLKRDCFASLGVAILNPWEAYFHTRPWVIAVSCEILGLTASRRPLALASGKAAISA